MGAVVGHCWSAYVGFAGGMGMSTLGGLFLWQQPLVVLIGVALWGLGYFMLHNSPRAVMIMTVLMVPVFWLLGSFGYGSREAVVLGIGGVGVIFIRHLTQLHVYDQRTAAE